MIAMKNEALKPLTDEEFSAVRIKARIAPAADNWPDDLLHFQKMKRAMYEARDRVERTYEALDAIEADPNLSAQGRAERCREIAEQVMSEHKASPTLARAKEAVASVQARWDARIADALKPPKDHVEATLHAQIREHVSQMKEGRVQFLNEQGGDPSVAAALLLAPPFLSGLSEGEVTMLQHKIEVAALGPEVGQARAETAKAWAATQSGWDGVAALITERVGPAVLDRAKPHEAVTQAS
jgi:hypothetical protein